MMNPHPELENMLMVQIVASAMDVLNYHLRDDNSFWIKCPINGHYNLDFDSFEKFYDGLKKHRFQNSRMESSKYTDIIALNSKSLVDLILDANKWADNFPTIISKAEILRVLEAGLLESRSGSLQLIYQKMHILSPIISPREYILLQHCQQIKIGMWVIVNVSYNKFEGSDRSYSSTYYWNHPSGWMIEELPNGFSKVTCIEHVEVDDDFQVHPIYKNSVKSTLGFGAKRWHFREHANIFLI
ncbi:homeobox-leucine zipper protein HDG8-like [Chenopodium quinoa]|uniref:homeobox-leucine zipper protein HDG8-like n=1 Tax=Chenopodium quinoa TaxID=63459 RepID=UPI000B76CCBC|nr:homeobox-leucine zipper protein HDG8-like [Chenopodium quinoa]